MPDFDTLAPWMAMALSGALHGLHPASGWPLLATCGLRGRCRWSRILPAMLLGCAGLATLQVTDLALVPALGSLCGDGTTIGEVVLPALAAAGIHLGAMLVTMWLAGNLAARAVRVGSALRQSMHRTSPFHGEAFSWNRSCRYCANWSPAMKSGTTKPAGQRLPSLPTA